MKTRIDTHDDVVLRDEETIAFWAMAHNADDDRVPCNFSGCERDAHWRHTCPGCGAVRFFCVPNIHLPPTRGWGVRHARQLGGCGQRFEWSGWNAAFLPM